MPLVLKNVLRNPGRSLLTIASVAVSFCMLGVLMSEQQLFTTESQLVTAPHDAAVAEFNVAAAIGRLIAPELKLPVQLYDMDKHYNSVKDKLFGFGGGLKE